MLVDLLSCSSSGGGRRSNLSLSVFVARGAIGASLPVCMTSARCAGVVERCLLGGKQ